MTATYSNCQYNNTNYTENYPCKIQEQANTTLHYYPHQKTTIVTNNRNILPRKTAFTYQNTQNKSVSSKRDLEKDFLMEMVDEEMLNKLCYAMGLDRLYYLPDLNLTGDLLERI